MSLWGQIIHLRRAQDRADQVQRLIKAAPCPMEVVDAVDGQEGPPEMSHYSAEPIYAPRYPFTLGAGEIACFLSHRNAWAAIVERRVPGIIYEDDTDIDPERHGAAVERARPFVEQLGVVMFQVRQIVSPADHVAPNLVIPHVAPLRLNTTLIAPWAAARLHELSNRFDRPVDTFLQMSWVTGIRPAIVQPSGVTEVSAQLGGSTIQAKRRGLVATVKREIARPLYRRRVAKASARYREKTL